MDCKHERLRCTNNQFFCLTCGMKIDKPPEPEKKPEWAAQDATEAATDGFERPSGRKIGFDAEKPKRRTRRTKAD